MKRLLSVFFIFIIVFSFAACSNSGLKNNVQENTKDTQDESFSFQEGNDVAEQGTVSEESEGNRILVAYFSLAGEQYEVGTIEKGNTQIIAEIIAE